MDDDDSPYSPAARFVDALLNGESLVLLCAMYLCRFSFTRASDAAE